MGYSVAIASAILFGAVAAIAFQSTARLADSRTELDRAWRDANQRAFDAAHAQARFANVSEDAGTVTVRLDNAGATALATGATNLVADGAPVAITSQRVDGQVRGVWAPGQQMVLEYAGAPPTSLALVSEYGTLATWRA